MSDLKLTGILYRKMDKQQITEKFSKRDFVIETNDEQYPQLVKFELVNDKTDLIDNYEEGQKITVKFNVTGREWKKDDGTVAYFTALKAWRIEAEVTNNPAPYSPPQSSPPVQQSKNAGNNGIDDDLPF